jgi:hypothetical protein
MIHYCHGECLPKQGNNGYDNIIVQLLNFILSEDVNFSLKTLEALNFIHNPSQETGIKRMHYCAVLTCLIMTRSLNFWVRAKLFLHLLQKQAWYLI